MPATKVIKPTSVETTRKPLEKPKQVKEREGNGAQRELKVPAVRKSRASSCSRCPDRCEGRTGEQGTTLKTSCERRTRSSSTATKTTTDWSRINPDYRLPGKHATVTSKCREMRACPGKRQQLGVRDETSHASHKAFTVIPPNPKKRKEIQRKAEAELAALEELRLRRAMAYVSINPSSVGGCMSLEEVRLKQQQEMMQAKRRQKPV